MRRIIILAAMAVIAAAAAAVWSFANPKVAGDVQVTDTSAQVSPSGQGLAAPIQNDPGLPQGRGDASAAA